MGLPLVVIVTLIYFGVGLGQFSDGRPGLGIMFIGYALANIGILWEMMR